MTDTQGGVVEKGFYDTTIQDNRVIVEVTKRGNAVVRCEWDDTRKPAWDDLEFGWVYTIPPLPKVTGNFVGDYYPTLDDVFDATKTH